MQLLSGPSKPKRIVNDTATRQQQQPVDHLVYIHEEENQATKNFWVRTSKQTNKQE